MSQRQGTWFISQTPEYGVEKKITLKEKPKVPNRGLKWLSLPGEEKTTHWQDRMGWLLWWEWSVGQVTRLHLCEHPGAGTVPKALLWHWRAWVNKGQAWHLETPSWQASGGPMTSHLSPSPPGSTPLREDRSLEVPHRLLLMAELPGWAAHRGQHEEVEHSRSCQGREKAGECPPQPDKCCLLPPDAFLILRDKT